MFGSLTRLWEQMFGSNFVAHHCHCHDCDSFLEVFFISGRSYARDYSFVQTEQSSSTTLEHLFSGRNWPFFSIY